MTRAMPPGTSGDGTSGWRYRAALFGLIVFLVAANLTAVLIDRTPLFADSLDLFSGARDVADQVRQDESPLPTLMRATHKPPLVKALAGLALVPQTNIPSTDVPVLVIQLFFALLVVSVYAATRGLFPEEHPSVALLAAFAAGVTPAVFGMSKTVMTDLPLAAMVWAAIAMLLRTDGFRRLGASALLGVAGGLGLLVKQPFAVFLFVPVLAVAVPAVMRDDARGRAIGGTILAAATALIVAGPWYVKNLADSYAVNLADNELPTSLADLALETRLLTWIWDRQLGWVLSAFVLLGVVRLIAASALRRSYGKRLVAMAACLFVPWLFFSSAGRPMPRFLLPWAPAFAVVLAVGIAGRGRAALRSKSRWPARPVVAAMVFLGTAQFVFLNTATVSWHRERTTLERAAALPGIAHYPGGTNEGLFRVNRSGLDAWTVERALSRGRGGEALRVIFFDDGWGDELARRLDTNLRLRRPPGRLIRIDSGGLDFVSLRAKDEPVAWAGSLVAGTRCPGCLSPRLTRLFESLGPAIERTDGFFNEDGGVIVFRNREHDPEAPPPAIQVMDRKRGPATMVERFKESKP